MRRIDEGRPGQQGVEDGERGQEDQAYLGLVLLHTPSFHERRKILDILSNLFHVFESRLSREFMGKVPLCRM